MRHVALSVAAVMAVVVSSSAFAGGGITGTYATTIKSPAQLKGRWVLTLVKGGTYKVALNGEPLARGTYSTTATAITFRESAVAGCGGTGTYGWKKSGTTLTFTRKRESPKCPERAVVLRHTFTQLR